MPSFSIGDRRVGDNHATYFIADISANHDGELSRAVDLVHMAAEAGADAAKFQHFRARHIVSDYGFRSLESQKSHQANWEKSVYEVYEDASVPWEWTSDLSAACADAGVHFFSAAYDFEAVDMLNEHMEVYKIGSGDISWPEMLSHVASKGKAIILATGACDLADVQRAVATLRPFGIPLCLMQCNTNYTASPENFKHVHLRVLEGYRTLFPDLVLGLSDHTPGHATVLGAVALGARIVEKHFTDDNNRKGPDHLFSMTPTSWREMVDRTRELEYALGDPEKRVSDNERQTVEIQRRCLRVSRDLVAGHILGRDDIDVLRPAHRHGIQPWELDRALGMKLRKPLVFGEHLTREGLEPAD